MVWLLARLQAYLLFFFTEAFLKFNTRYRCVCCCCYCVGNWAAQRTALRRMNERFGTLEYQPYRWVSLEEPGCCICACCAQDPDKLGEKERLPVLYTYRKIEILLVD